MRPSHALAPLSLFVHVPGSHFCSRAVYLPAEFISVGEARLMRPCIFFLARGRVQLIRPSARLPSGYATETLEGGRLVKAPSRRGPLSGPTPLSRWGTVPLQAMPTRRYFQELGLFTDHGARLTARAMTHVDLYSLARSDFDAALSERCQAAAPTCDCCSQLVTTSPRLLLAAAGCCWLLLAAAGCCWLLLAAAGCCWLLLAAAGCCWLLLAAADVDRRWFEP
jgi:hypothetical protein